MSRLAGARPGLALELRTVTVAGAPPGHPYLVLLPAGWDRAVPLPVVLVLAGRWASGQRRRRRPTHPRQRRRP